MSSFLIISCSVIVAGVIVYILYKYFFSKSGGTEKYSDTYKPDDFIISKLKKDITLIDPRFKNIELNIGDSSYTQDKEKIYLCLSPRNGEKKYYNYQMLLHVLLHELAHYISKSQDPDHITPEFHQNFKYLIERAKQLNLYDGSERVVEDYCM
jgi:hypothetical protein